MGFKLFDQIEISTEDGIVGVVAAEPLDVTLVVEAQEAMDEMNAIVKDFDHARDSLALADTVTANLEQQIAVETAIMAKPESVTSSTVVLSMESLHATAALIGAESLVAMISTEAIEGNPVSSLEISIEEKGALIKKIVESIKLIFKKFVTMLKSLYVKAVVAMTGIAKQAKSLKAMLDENKANGKDVVLDDKMAAAVKGKLGAAIVKLGGNKFDTTFANKYIAELKDSAQLAEFGKVPTSMKDLIDTVAGKDKIKAEELVTDTATAGKSDTVISYSGMGVKTLVANVPVEKDKEYTGLEGAKVLTRVTFSVKSTPVEDKEFTLKDIKYSDLGMIANQITVPAEKAKDYLTEVEKATADVEKAIEDIAKTEDDKYIAAVKFGNVMVSNIALDKVLGYVNGLKNLMGVVSAVAKVALAKDDKPADDKKEEAK